MKLRRINIYPTVGAIVKLNLCIPPPPQHSVGEEQIQKAYEGVVGLKHRPKCGHLLLRTINRRNIPKQNHET